MVEAMIRLRKGEPGATEDGAGRAARGGRWDAMRVNEERIERQFRGHSLCSFFSNLSYLPPLILFFFYNSKETKINKVYRNFLDPLPVDQLISSLLQIYFFAVYLKQKIYSKRIMKGMSFFLCGNTLRCLNFHGYFFFKLRYKYLAAWVKRCLRQATHGQRV